MINSNKDLGVEKPIIASTVKADTNRSELANNLSASDELVTNKLVEVQNAVGPKQAVKFKEALDICDEEAKNSEDDTVAEKWIGIKNLLLHEIHYTKIHGKNCIIFPMMPKAWSIEDATAQDFEEKFGLYVHPSLSDSRRFYSLTSTGLNKIPLPQRKVHIPDDETYKNLIKWLNNGLPRDKTKNSFLANGYIGKILEKICSLGYPGMYGSYPIGGLGQGSEERAGFVGFSGEVMSADATEVMGHYNVLDYNNKGDVSVSQVVSHIKPLVRFYEE